MKKISTILLTAMLSLSLLTACGSDTDDTITVVSREEGSGTRGAFVELFGILQKDENGDKLDKTIDYADQTNSTGVMLQSVSQNPTAIGYVSLGSLNDSVKAVTIDGVEATIDNIKSGDYPISRPFNIATYGATDELTEDFILFILSADGQSIVEDVGYIPATNNATPYESATPAGTIVVAGSSSVSPVMEKLIEAYALVNTNGKVELQNSDSTTGMTTAMDGVAQIGMASRALKDSELSAGLSPIVIAMDGIAVVAHLENPLANLTQEQVMNIYTGVVTSWTELS